MKKSTLGAKTAELTVTPGSGNVFKDLGLPNPEDRLARARLVYILSCKIEESGLSKREVSAKLKLDESKISDLLLGRTTGYTVSRLMRLLVALNQDVTIVITNHAPNDSLPAEVSVRMESEVRPGKTLKKAV